MNPDPDEHVHPGQEDLQWGQGIKEKNREKQPNSKYWAISEQARKMIPGETTCKMFCGGKACKYCTTEFWTAEQMAVTGIYSEWVTDNILAMARPSNHNILKYKILEQFSRLEIRTVINLQMPGEHATCGFGNDSGGFSYSTQKIMESGMFFYNFAMPDYGIASLQTLLDTVKVMQFAVSQGKVAVHCHAGLGRTGLIIACYLIYNNRVKASKAVQYIRSRRKNSIQTKEQVKTCHEFEKYLQPFFVIFPSKAQEAHEFSFNHFLLRQSNLLHGYEARKLKHIPKVIYVCCERLLELCGQGKSLETLREATLDPLPPDLDTLTRSNSEDSILSRDSDRETTNCNNYSSVVDNSNCSESVLDKRKCQKNSLGCDDIDDEEDDDDDVIFNINNEKITSLKREAELRKAQNEEITVFKERRKSLKSTSVLPVISVQDVCQSIVNTDLSQSQQALVSDVESSLNKSDDTWRSLAEENDAVIVANVMWDWLDQLHEPVLNAQDVSVLVEHCNTPTRALMYIQKSTRHFVEYLAKVVSKLAGEEMSSADWRRWPREQQVVVECLLGHLCQKRLGLGMFHFPSEHSIVEEEKPDVSEKVFMLFVSLVQHKKK